jgi:hypothetical protein
MRAHTITTPRPAALLSLLALGALGLLVGGGAGQSAAATPAATGAQAVTTLETTITKHPSHGRLIRGVAYFEFTANQPGATFECAVDAKPFKPCTSPLRVGNVKGGNSTARRRVGSGKHELQVRATVGGVTDATPARARWKSLVEPGGMKK